jgi:hypothetical protein
MAANQVDFKILPSDQFSVYSPQTRSDKVITYFTLLSKLRGDILSVGQDDDPNDIVSAFYSIVGGTQTLHLVKADGSEITASVPEPTVGTVTSVDLTASTGISVSGGPITTSGSITVTNTAPDQVVVLTGAGTTSISGTYPSFTITSNDQFVGTVTSVGTSGPITGGPITATGTIGITQSGAAADGYLSSTDWNTFNSKEPALTKGNLTEATSAVLTITGGTGAVIGTGTSIQVAQSGVSTSGFLSSTDWNTFNGKASNSFTTIAVATQNNIVADTATDTLTIVAGAGISLTTNDSTDTLTITNTAVTNIACFAAYSTTTIVFDNATQTEVSLEFDEQSVINPSFYTHSTTVDPNIITVLSAGLYEISFGYCIRNGISSAILSVGAAVAVNGTSSFTPFSFMQLNKPGLEIDTGSLVNTYIYNLAANDDIEVYVFFIDAGGNVGTFDVNPSDLYGSTYITIKKLS